MCFEVLEKIRHIGRLCFFLLMARLVFFNAYLSLGLCECCCGGEGGGGGGGDVDGCGVWLLLLLL